MNKTEQFIEILKDESLAKELFKKETPEEVRDFLNEKGIECSLEDVSMIGGFMASVVGKSADSELSEDALAEVAGGSVGWPWEEGHFDEAKEQLKAVGNALDTAAQTAILYGSVGLDYVKDFFRKW